MFFSLYNNIKKVSVLTIVGVLILTPFTFFSFPEKTEALGCPPAPVVPVPNPLFVPVQDLGMGSVIAQSAQTSESFKKCILDPLGTLIAKQIIQSITFSMVTWINSGFEGNPSFIENPGRFFESVGDRIAGQMIEQIAPFLCSPFKLNLSLMLALEFGGTTPQEQTGCTLTQITGNVEGFVDNTTNQANAIGNGGWKNWFQVSQKQTNNPDGALLKARSQIGASISTSQGEIGLGLNWGSGFFPMQDCTAAGKKGLTTKKGDKKVYDANNEPVYGVSVNQKNCVTRTPGALIENQLGTLVSSDLRGLEIAQSLDQIFGALVGQMMKQALGGLGGVIGAGGSGQGGGSFDFNNMNLGEDLPSIPLTGSCSPNKDAVQVGEAVVWRLYIQSASGDQLSYTWQGVDENNTSGGKVVSTSTTVISTYQTTGSKRAEVIVKKSTNPLTINLGSEEDEVRTFTCSPAVTVTTEAPTNARTIEAPNFEPQNKTNSAELSCTVESQRLALNNSSVRYNITELGNSTTTKYEYKISSDDEYAALVTNNLTVENNKHLIVQYTTGGEKKVTINVLKENGELWYANCPVVTVESFSCDVDKSTASTNSIVTYSVSDPAGSRLTNSRKYRWLNSSGQPNPDVNQTVNNKALAVYTLPGVKGMSVEIEESVQSGTPLWDAQTRTQKWTISCPVVTITGSGANVNTTGSTQQTTTNPNEKSASQLFAELNTLIDLGSYGQGGFDKPGLYTHKYLNQNFPSLTRIRSIGDKTVEYNFETLDAVAEACAKNKIPTTNKCSIKLVNYDTNNAVLVDINYR